MTTVAQEGRRFYLENLPFAQKDRAKSLGCKWDPQRKAWWTGKRDVAERVAGRVNEAQTQVAQQEREDGISTSAHVVIGRASYRGKTYYLLAAGTSQRTGKRYAKLAFRDGSKVFWATDFDAFEVLKRYEEPRSIDSLRAYAERAKAGGGHRLEEGYYYGPGGEVLASGCHTCSQLGHMCRSCEHDYE